MSKATQLTKKLVAAALCTVFAVGSTIGSAAEGIEQTKKQNVSERYIDVSDKLPDSDVLFGEYVNKKFGIENGASSGSKKLPYPSMRKDLSNVDQAIYDILLEQIEQVADGEITSTIFNVSKSDLMERAGFGAGFSSLDIDAVIGALLFDCPYELYWYDKTKGITAGGLFNMEFKFPVSADYSASGDEDTYDTNSNKTAAAGAAATNARNVLKGVDSNWSDYKTLSYFKEAICERVSYNYDAASNSGDISYGDPWQMIYVFDGDSNTNVVCEGYAKAFKYLCDSHKFNSNVKCNIMTGNMASPTTSGGHMWNMITIGDKNYLVDITNSDSGTIGEKGDLFIVGVPDSNRLYEDNTFVGAKFKLGWQNVVYKYDSSARRTLTEKELNISKTSPTLHTVQWKGQNGTVLEEDVLVADGERPVYNGSVPKSNRGEFTGWNPEITEDTVISGTDETIVYKAVFGSETYEEYTVKFCFNDEVLSTVTVDEGDKVTAADDPEVSGCKFAGWYTDDTFSTPYDFDKPVTGDMELYAKFICHVSWCDNDGTVLAEKDVTYGETPHYPGETPTKESDEKFDYEFSDWTPKERIIDRDTKYIAYYKAVLRKYTVTWKNYDGTVLEVDENVPYGMYPTYNGDAPEMENAEFEGWEPAISPITGNTEFTAKFSGDITYCTVTWKNHDGTVLAVDEQVPDGAVPSYKGETPERESTVENDYKFEGWSPSNDTAIHEDSEFTAVFTETPREYKITWKNWDGSILKTTQQKYGDTPEYNGDTPSRPSDNEYIYKFNGWNPELSPINGDSEYTAKFTETRISDEPSTDEPKESDSDKDTSTDSQPNTDTDVNPGTDTELKPDTDTDKNKDSDNEPPRTLGDSNNDGKTDSSDALLILRASLDMESISEEDFKYCDIDKNGKIDSYDAVLILRSSVGYNDNIDLGKPL